MAEKSHSQGPHGDCVNGQCSPRASHVTGLSFLALTGRELDRQRGFSHSAKTIKMREIQGCDASVPQKRKERMVDSRGGARCVLRNLKERDGKGPTALSEVPTTEMEIRFGGSRIPNGCLLLPSTWNRINAILPRLLQYELREMLRHYRFLGRGEGGKGKGDRTKSQRRKATAAKDGLFYVSQSLVPCGFQGSMQGFMEEGAKPDLGHFDPSSSVFNRSRSCMNRRFRYQQG